MNGESLSDQRYERSCRTKRTRSFIWRLKWIISFWLISPSLCSISSANIRRQATVERTSPFKQCSTIFLYVFTAHSSIRLSERAWKLKRVSELVAHFSHSLDFTPTKSVWPQLYTVLVLIYSHHDIPSIPVLYHQWLDSSTSPSFWWSLSSSSVLCPSQKDDPSKRKRSVCDSHNIKLSSLSLQTPKNMPWFLKALYYMDLYRPNYWVHSASSYIACTLRINIVCFITVMVYHLFVRSYMVAPYTIN